MFRFLLKLSNHLYSLLFKIKVKILYGSKINVSKVFFGRNAYITIGNSGYLELGHGFSCRRNASINVDAGKIIIGKNVFLNDNCSLNCIDSIEIGDECIFGHNVLLFDHDHEFRKGGVFSQTGMTSNPITIGRNVWIGSGVIILKGAIIGENSVIGANTIIKSIIPPNSVVYEQKAIVIKGISTLT